MTKVFLLIFAPGATWERIAQMRRGYLYIFATYLLPFLAVVTTLEVLGLERWGKWQPKYQVIKQFSPREIFRFESVQIILFLAILFIAALLVLRISRTFHERNTYLQAFTLVAYAFGPWLILRLLDFIPSMNPMATWGVGIALMVWILYQGVPRILQPDPTHAFGLYLASLFVMLLTSALVRVITGLYLLGYLDFHHSALIRIFAPVMKP